MPTFKGPVFLFFSSAAILFTSGSNTGIDKRITGDWIFSGYEGSSETDCCPDFISFMSDGSYRLFNDCYGAAESALCESGYFELNQKGDELILKKRRFHTNYHFQDSSARLKIFIMKSDPAELHFCYGKRQGCQAEIFRKVK